MPVSIALVCRVDDVCTRRKQAFKVHKPVHGPPNSGQPSPTEEDLCLPRISLRQSVALGEIRLRRTCSGSWEMCHPWRRSGEDTKVYIQQYVRDMDGGRPKRPSRPSAGAYPAAILGKGRLTRGGDSIASVVPRCLRLHVQSERRVSPMPWLGNI